MERKNTEYIIAKTTFLPKRNTPAGNRKRAAKQAKYLNIYYFEISIALADSNLV